MMRNNERRLEIWTEIIFIERVESLAELIPVACRDHHGWYGDVRSRCWRWAEAGTADQQNVLVFPENSRYFARGRFLSKRATHLDTGSTRPTKKATNWQGDVVDQNRYSSASVGVLESRGSEVSHLTSVQRGADLTGRAGKALLRGRHVDGTARESVQCDAVRPVPSWGLC